MSRPRKSRPIVLQNSQQALDEEASRVLGAINKTTRNTKSKGKRQQPNSRQRDSSKVTKASTSRNNLYQFLSAKSKAKSAVTARNRNPTNGRDEGEAPRRARERTPIPGPENRYREILSTILNFGVTFTVAHSTRFRNETVFHTLWNELKTEMPYGRPRECTLEYDYYTQATSNYHTLPDPAKQKWCLIRDFFYSDCIPAPLSFLKEEINPPPPPPPPPPPLLAQNYQAPHTVQQFESYKWISPIIWNPSKFINDIETIFELISFETKSVSGILFAQMPYHIHISANTFLPDYLESITKFCVINLFLEEILDLFHLRPPLRDSEAPSESQNPENGQCFSMLQAWREMYATSYRRQTRRERRQQQEESEPSRIINSFRGCRAVGEVVTLFNPALSRNVNAYGNYSILDDVPEDPPAAGAGVGDENVVTRQKFMVNKLYKINVGHALYNYKTVEFRQGYIAPRMLGDYRLNGGAADGDGGEDGEEEGSDSDAGEDDDDDDDDEYLFYNPNHALLWLDFCLRFASAFYKQDISWATITHIGTIWEAVHAENCETPELLWLVLASMMEPDTGGAELLWYFYEKYHRVQSRREVNRGKRRRMREGKMTIEEFEGAVETGVEDMAEFFVTDVLRLGTE
ncbi:hypothetical protein DFH27DRAFT_523803 [Peziza echinospora]|nr:hypothetical protein DFH27DRAFT_523803 [Peziza echinospora]